MKSTLLIFLSIMLSLCFCVQKEKDLQTKQSTVTHSKTKGKKTQTFPLLRSPSSANFCPEGTEQKSFTMDIDVDQCLDGSKGQFPNYVHYKKEHGVLRQRICFHYYPKSDRLQNSYSKGEVFRDVVLAANFPTENPDIEVKVKTNASHYQMQLLFKDGEVRGKNEPPNPSDVKKIFKSIELPEKVELIRCVCNHKKHGVQNCTEMLFQ